MKLKRLVSATLAGVLLLYPLVSIVPSVSAANLQVAMVRFDRMKVSTATTGTVCAKPQTVATEADVQVTFPTGYTLGAAGTFTVSTTNLAWPTTAVAWPSIATATNVTGQVATFPSGDLTVGTLYCFNWASNTAVTQTATAGADKVGSVKTRTAGAATIDSSSYATATIADDQITVLAKVAPTLSFALSTNSVDLGTLNSASVTTGATVNATFSTNALNGVTGWMQSSNGNLTSPGTLATIPSPGTNNGVPEVLTAGTSGYVVDIDTNTNGSAGTGVVTIDPEYNGAASGGGRLATTLQTIFTTTGTHQGGIVNIIPKASISAIQSAADDYRDTLTIVAAGRF
jgi:hypothetical protein